MRIGIDARFYGPSGKGIGRYTQKLIESLEKLDQENEYFIFLRQENFDLYQPRNERFKKVLANFPLYSWQEQIPWPLMIKKYPLDLIHFASFNVPIKLKQKFTITIHDLAYLKLDFKTTTRPALVYILKYFFSRLVAWLAIQKSTKIITVSEFVKKQIIDYYKIDPNKIIVTYEATDNYMNNQNINQNTNIAGQYLLYVGNAYPHKNLAKLLEAFKKINAEIKLVLVGKADYFYQQLQKLAQELKIENRVIFFGPADDQQLKNLYQNALAYIFPSLMEGFGLPGLEAMSAGCPVLSSNAGSLPEIYQDAALYFDPNNVDDITHAIEKIIQDPNLRENLRQKGFNQIKKYSWQKCGQETLAIYKSILNQ